MALNRRLFDHVGIIHIIHIRHAAFGMAGRQIAAEQIILFGCRPWAACADHQIGVAAQYFALRGVGLEFIGADANGHTGLTIEAAWPVCDILAAAKSDAAQRFVQLVCVVAVQLRKNLALGLAGQIWTRPRGGHKKPRKTDWCAHILSALVLGLLRRSLPFMHRSPAAEKRINHDSVVPDYLLSSTRSTL